MTDSDLRVAPTGADTTSAPTARAAAVDVFQAAPLGLVVWSKWLGAGRGGFGWPQRPSVGDDRLARDAAPERLAGCRPGRRARVGRRADRGGRRVGRTERGLDLGRPPKGSCGGGPRRSCSSPCASTGKGFRSGRARSSPLSGHRQRRDATSAPGSGPTTTSAPRPGVDPIEWGFGYNHAQDPCGGSERTRGDPNPTR
jgi:hypothetical protein